MTALVLLAIFGVELLFAGLLVLARLGEAGRPSSTAGSVTSGQRFREGEESHQRC